MDEDDVWTPPTDAEMKVILARRERSDKISKLMGEYLLKGYKMLGISCEICGVSKTATELITILFFFLPFKVIPLAN